MSFNLEQYEAELEAAAFTFSQFAEGLAKSPNLADTREQFDALGGKGGYLYVPVEKAQTVYDDIGAALAKRGLDFTSTDDRIIGYLEALREEHTRSDVEVVRAAPMRALSRILSGCDLAADRLEFLPLEKLVHKSLGYPLEREGTYWATRGDWIPDTHPNKYIRTVKDPRSEFWRCSVYYDDFPGRRRLNASLRLPTGRISLESMREFDKSAADYGSDQMWVQTIHLGDHDVALDTESALAERFLAFVKEQNAVEAPKIAS